MEEEFGDGTWAIVQPGPNGKEVGTLIVSTLGGGGKQEDWYLITQVPNGSNYDVYVWPDSNHTDMAYRFIRTGAPGNPPSYGSGVSTVGWRHQPTQI